MSNKPINIRFERFANRVDALERAATRLRRARQGPKRRRNPARGNAQRLSITTQNQIVAAQRMLNGNPVSEFSSIPNGIRGLFRGSLAVTNTSTPGVLKYVISLDFIAASGLKNISSTFEHLYGLYRQFKINAIAVKIAPITASTSGGYVAVGYEPDASQGNPTGLSGVTDHSAHVVVPSGTVDYLYLTPPHLPRDFKAVTDNAGLPRIDTSFGSFQVYGDNASAASVAVAVIDLALDITFTGLA